MESLTDFALKEKYERVRKLRGRLEEMKVLLDWKAFARLFPEKEKGPGRPEYDPVLMIKMLFLQAWYGISDEELEFQVNDRLSFQQFLGFPKTVPDYTTVWYFRERITELDLHDKIWDELRSQLAKHNLNVKEGSVQDARFIDADPGKKRSGMEGRGREAKTSRSKDGTWTKKYGKSHFGFKLHTKVARVIKIVESFAVTTAKTHDSCIDLGTPDDDVLYRDKAFTGVPTKAKGNGSMKRGKLTVKEQLRNKRISKKRCQGEHPYGIMQRCFKAGRTRLTTLGRVFTQHLFLCSAYNLHRLNHLLKPA